MAKLLKMMRFLKAVRVLRIVKMQILFRGFGRIVGSVYWKVARFIMIVALLSHWLACIFHYVAYVNEETDTMTWVKKAHIEDCSFRLRLNNPGSPIDQIV